jgi:transcriptional regulator with XRE-family HTH domain
LGDRVLVRSQSLSADQTWEGETIEIIGSRLRDMRDQKKLSQEDIEKRTACFDAKFRELKTGIRLRRSRHRKRWHARWKFHFTVSSMRVRSRPNFRILPKRKSSDEIAWGRAGKDARFLSKLRRLLSKTEEADRRLLMHVAPKITRPNARQAASN